jgi:tagaturonate reductase
MAENLSRKFLADGTLAKDIEIAEFAQMPVKVLQFGEGNFLRAFVDFMIDELNEKGLFGGKVAVVQPIANGLADALNAQDGLYTAILRGRQNKQEITRKRIVTCLDTCINPYTLFDTYIAAAENPDLRFVVSNTTEAGIAYRQGDTLDDKPQTSFPGKVCALLYRRFKHFGGDSNKGLVFIPCELIDNNGTALREIVLKYAAEWKLEEAFVDWVHSANCFTNTLVDRIVTGYPRDEADALQASLGYEDKLLVTAEIFHFFAIEAPVDVMPKISQELPFDKAGLNVIWTADATPYKQRKVRILNGAHTMSVLAAYLAGKETVGEMMQDDVFVQYLRRGIFDEIIPTLDLKHEDLTSIADAVFDRFENPFIRHYLLSIALNSVSKYKVRVLPSILEYHKRKGKLPALLALSMAALIFFYFGKEIVDGALLGTRDDGTSYKIADDMDVLEFFRDAGTESSTREELTRKVLGKVEFWGEDLNALPGFHGAVSRCLEAIDKTGVKATMASLLSSSSSEL